ELERDLSGPDLSSDVRGLKFAPGGRRLVASWGGKLGLWDAETGKPLKTINAPPNLFDLAFHPSGTRLAGATRDFVKLWDAETLQEVLTLPGPHRDGDPGFTPKVRFSPDGHWLAYSGYRANVYLFDGRPRSSDEDQDRL